MVAESVSGETRVAATPATTRTLLGLGYEVVVEPGAGEASGFTDQAYADAGAAIGEAWDADVVLKVNAPSDTEIRRLRRGATLVALLSPAQKPELLQALADAGITALALDAVPRISRAQSMDVLSSMANIAGYRAVIEAAHVFGRFFTGQVTAARQGAAREGPRRRCRRGRSRRDRRCLQPRRRRTRHRPPARGRRPGEVPRR
ncbi:hypothetical protein GCM10020256_73900 [Streptomyces thermocoprophilus]